MHIRPGRVGIPDVRLDLPACMHLLPHVDILAALGFAFPISFTHFRDARLEEVHRQCVDCRKVDCRDRRRTQGATVRRRENHGCVPRDVLHVAIPPEVRLPRHVHDRRYGGGDPGGAVSVFHDGQPPAATTDGRANSALRQGRRHGGKRMPEILPAATSYGTSRVVRDHAQVAEAPTSRAYSLRALRTLHLGVISSPTCHTPAPST